mmetsp:Transcript_21020/g.46093  ORF Transcript_21020/g.46093 Transcript_21020/m.46093 type:complete len:272 (+) Transcript_21020:243-1058(+)
MHQPLCVISCEPRGAVVAACGRGAPGFAGVDAGAALHDLHHLVVRALREHRLHHRRCHQVAGNLPGEESVLGCDDERRLRSFGLQPSRADDGVGQAGLFEVLLAHQLLVQHPSECVRDDEAGRLLLPNGATVREDGGDEDELLHAGRYGGIHEIHRANVVHRMCCLRHLERVAWNESCGTNHRIDANETGSDSFRVAGHINLHCVGDAQLFRFVQVAHASDDLDAFPSHKLFVYELPRCPCSTNNHNRLKVVGSLAWLRQQRESKNSCSSA